MTPSEEDVAAQLQLVLHHLGIRGTVGERLSEELAAHVINGVELATPQVLSPAQVADAREIFEGKNKDRSACHHCAGLHSQVAGLMMDRQPCPRIRRLSRHVDGSVHEVVYWPPGEWEANVIFPHDVYEDDTDIEDDID